MKVFEIKDFGNDTTCLSVKDLQDKLITKYANKSVAIHSTNNRGFRHIIGFVDVKSNQVYNTYGNKNLFNFSKLSEKTNTDIEKANKTKGTKSQTLAKRRAKNKASHVLRH